MKKLLLILLMWGIGVSALFAGGNPPVQGWNNLGSGVNGEVNAIAIYNGDIYAGGEFTIAGGNSISFIAKWDGTQWTSLGSGVNGFVDAMAVYNGELYAGGTFTVAGGNTVSNIARWNGTSWSAVGSGVNNDVRAMIVYNGELVVGGAFTNQGSHIAKWNGTSWSSLGSGVDDDVHALTLHQGNLIAGGRFDNAGGNPASMVARWNGSIWSAVSSQSFDDRVFALGVLNDTLYAGGRFEEVGGDPTKKSIVRLAGTNWIKVGNGVEDNKEVNTMTTFKGELVIGGAFEFAYNISGSLTVYCIARWNGSRWDRFQTGFDERVSSLFTNISGSDTTLLAGGEFFFAGGRPANHIAEWRDSIQTYSVEGTVRYTSNGQPVNGGYVKAVRLELATRQFLTLDSVQINPVDGTYKLNKVRGDTVDIIAFPNDVIGQDFIPTYHNGTLFWEGSASVLLQSDTTGIDISVVDAQPSDNPTGTGTISGKVALNYLPTGFLSGLGEEFTGGSNVYAELTGGVFKNFDISDDFQNFEITSLPAGTYNIIVNRLGYESDTMVVNLTNGGTVNNINFLINPLDNPVSVQNINNSIPDNITLYQNYPNPFNPTTNIRFDIKNKSAVTMYLYNSLGQVVQKLINNETYSPGSYELSLDASGLASGVYFYKLVTNETSLTKKMVVIK